MPIWPSYPKFHFRIARHLVSDYIKTKKPQIFRLEAFNLNAIPSIQLTSGLPVTLQFVMLETGGRLTISITTHVSDYLQ
jgi:hypothetical protein